MDWIRPDDKTQITLECDNSESGGPIHRRTYSIFISDQHSKEVNNNNTAANLMEYAIMKPIVPGNYFNDKMLYHMNLSGQFVTVGPHSNMGLTGH